MKISRVPAAARPKSAPPRKVAMKDGALLWLFSQRPMKLVNMPSSKGVISRLMPVMDPKLKTRLGKVNEMARATRIPPTISRVIIKGWVFGVLAASDVYKRQPNLQ